jgi:autotransporter-associated beta strand protein
MRNFVKRNINSPCHGSTISRKRIVPVRRTRSNAVLAAAIATTMSMSAAQFADAANSSSVFSTTATDLSVGTNYTPNITPTTAKTTDVQFSGNYTTPAGLTVNGAALNFGTLNDITTQSLVISNSATNKAGSITLNTASNSTSGANASDLLYVASNGNLSIVDGTGTSTTTLNFAATGSIDDAGTLAISALTVADGDTISSAGGGTLTLGPDAFNLGPNTANATLDLSGLGSFTYNGSSSTFGVDTETAGTLTTSGISATMKLAGNNSITAMAINVGIGKGGDPQASEVGVLQLGQANVLDTGNLTIGLNRDGGTLNFSSVLTSPTVTIAGTTGGTSRATIIIGQNNSGAGGTGPSVAATRTSTLDFSNSSGTNPGVETVLASNVTVGNDNRGSAGTPAIAASLVLGAGSFDATTITLAQDVSGDTTSDFPNGSAVTNVGIVGGTLTTGSGTLNVGTLTLGQHVSGSADAITGTVNLNNGGTIYATTIQAGANAGTGNAAIRIFNWGNGTIGNYRNLSAADTAETNLAITSAVTWNLASTGTHTFNIDAGYGGTVGAVLAGTGTLVKEGGGTLTLSAANTYSGGTTISAGTLVGTSTSALGNGTLIVTNGATFAYQPVAAGALSISSGVLTLANGSTIGGAIGGTAGQSTISSSSAASVTGNVTVNIYGTPEVTVTSGTNNLITAAGGLGTTSNYALGGIYNATNFTVSSGTLAATATAVSIGVSSQAAISGNEYWNGGFSGGVNVWALSDGSANSNWVTSQTGGATSLIPGPAATVVFSATGASNQGSMVLGADMSVAGITVNDTTPIALNADGNSLTIGTGGITINSSSGNPSVSIAAPLTLGGAQSWTNNSTNALTISAAVTNGGNLLTVAGTGNTSISGAIVGTGGLTKSSTGTLTLSGVSAYTGSTTINSGTLEVDGSLAPGSAVAVGGSSASGKPFLTGIGTVNGTVSLASAGSGAAGKLSPGTVGGIGTLTTGAETWNSGATYQWDIGSSAGTLASGVNGTPGTTYDDLVATAGLTVPTAGMVTIAPTGSLTGITAGTTYTWVLAQINTLSVGGAGVTASGTPISSDFTLNTSGLNASINGGTSTTAAGTFSLFFEAETVPSSTNDLVLSYTAAPEPGAATLFAAGAGSLLMRRRRRQRAYDISVLL